MGGLRGLISQTQPLCFGGQNPTGFGISVKILAHRTVSIEETGLTDQLAIRLLQYAPLPEPGHLPMPCIAQKRVPGLTARPRGATDMARYTRVAPDLGEPFKILRAHRTEC